VKVAHEALAPRDPRAIVALYADRAAGLSAEEIAAKHNLPAPTVYRYLRSLHQPCGLRRPYDYGTAPLPDDAAVQIYWLGYVAACGRVVGQGNAATLVLAIHPHDEPHVQLLVADLVRGHARMEFADSSLEGRQAYVRDPVLAEVLAQWGLAGSLAAASVTLDYVPAALVFDFVRGYLEGSRRAPPFGGPRAMPLPPGRTTRLAVVGPPPLVESLRRVLRACGVGGGELEPARPSGLVALSFPPAAGATILARAYARPVRSSPRAARFVARFAAPR
jgi:AcrR family transcriptional regulator